MESVVLPPANRRNNLNLFRLVFAVLVIFSHSFELIDTCADREPLVRIFQTISFGTFAVNGFFLLSGYLIVHSWESDPRPLSFLRKRILRIYPGFIVAFLVCVLVVGPLGSNAALYFHQIHLPKIFEGMIMLQRPETPSVFAGQPYDSTNGAMWTIHHEFACYITVLIFGVFRLFGRRSIWLVAGLTLALLHLIGMQTPSGSVNLWSHNVRLDRQFFHLGNYFFAGGCFRLFRDRITFNWKFASVCLVLLPLGVGSFIGTALLLPVIMGYLLFFFGFMPIRILSGFERFPDISYGVYLYGWPVQKLILWYCPIASPWALFPLACVGAFALGLISWIYIEKPFLRFK